MNRLLARMLGRLYREENPDDAGGAGGGLPDGARYSYHDRAAWLEQIAATTEDDLTLGTGTHDVEVRANPNPDGLSDEALAQQQAAQAEIDRQAEEDAAALAAQQAAASTTGDDQMVTLIVDGKEVTRPLSEVLDAGKRYLQKDMTADERLVEATRILKEANEKFGKPQPAERPSEALPVEDDDAALARAIQLGSDEEARAAIAKLRKSGRTDDTSITSMIDARIEFREAAAWVNTEYKDLLTDPLLGGVFMQKETEARKAGDKRPYRDLYKEIGDGLRKWRDGLAPKVDPLQDKESRKASVTVIPTARAVAPVERNEDDQETTDAQENAAYLAEMRRRRGQA
jgi:hypothetical protein